MTRALTWARRPSFGLATALVVVTMLRMVRLRAIVGILMERGRLGVVFMLGDGSFLQRRGFLGAGIRACGFGACPRFGHSLCRSIVLRRRAAVGLVVVFFRLGPRRQRQIEIAGLQRLLVLAQGGIIGRARNREAG